MVIVCGVGMFAIDSFLCRVCVILRRIWCPGRWNAGAVAFNVVPFVPLTWPFMISVAAGGIAKVTVDSRENFGRSDTSMIKQRSA